MEILIPKPGTWYIWNALFQSRMRLIGPFHDDGDPWERIKFSQDELNTFIQGNHFMGESSVFHQKIDGNIYVIPALSGLEVVGKDSRSGAPVYRVPLRQRYRGKYTNTHMDVVIDGLLAGADSWGVKDIQNLYVCHFTARHGHRTYVHNSATAFSAGERGNKWYPRGEAVTIAEVSADYCKYRVQSLGPWSGDAGYEVGGALTIESGRAMARRTAIYREATAGHLFEVPKYFLHDSDFSMSQIRAWINKLVSKELFENLPSPNLQNWGELSHHATSNLDLLSSNMLEFILELRNIKTLVPKLKELGKIKTHASNYLAAKYGILPTIDDLKSIFSLFKANRYFDRHGFTRVSAYDTKDSSFILLGQRVPITHTRRVHLAVNEMDTGLDSLVEKARNIGIFPSLGNLWDLVPYSFVIDWFVDVGSVLERIDTHHRLFNLDIPYVIKSDKLEAFVSKADHLIGAGFDISISRYNREVTTVVPQPRIFGDVNKPPTVQNHWIEGSALILQRTK